MITVENDCVRLANAVNNVTVPGLLTQIEALPQSALQLDLAGVTQVDSAAVSLLLTLRRQRGSSISVHNIPSNLRALIQLYDLDDILCQPAQ